MSGNYPDVPGQRMAYHRDGSVGFLHQPSTGELTVMSSANLNAINDEDPTTTYLSVTGAGGAPNNRYYGIIFPELRDIVGYFAYTVFFDDTFTGHIQTSLNTTSGVDGTWTERALDYINGGPPPAYRLNINSVSWLGIRSVRFKIDGGGSASDAGLLYQWHLYGKPSAGEVRYLMFTDVAGTEVTGPHFDFADDPRGGSVEDKTFKIKNGHASLTANSILVSCSTLTDKSPSFADDYTFSADGTTFTSTINVNILAPGVSSGTLHVRRTTPIGAALGLEAPLFSAVAGSWT